ncbi:MAG TPA: hypothetical protein PKC18_07625, partial [Lacipirellulaceae bacterium]|nr:hypothetical protein [Lacipirellulaceae bacterium]
MIASAMMDFLRRHWILVALAGILAAGTMWHESLAPWTALLPQDLMVASVLLAMSLSLETSAMAGALQRP